MRTGRGEADDGIPGARASPVDDPVALDDADVASVAGATAFAACIHAGQGCAITTRLVVPREKYDEAVQVAAATMESIGAKSPSDPSAICGPVISAAQRDRVASYLALAVEEGGTFAELTTLHLGGRPRLTVRCGSTTAVAGLSAVLVGVLLLTGGITLLVVDRVLVGQVDQQVRSEVVQAAVGGPRGGPGGPGGPVDPGSLLRGVGVGSLGARVVDGQVTAATLVGSSTGPPQEQSLGADQAAALAAVPLDEPVTVDVPGLGEYRVAATATDTGSVLVGQPLEPTATVVRELAAEAA